MAATKCPRAFFLDARETLGGFLVDGMPDADRFRSWLGALLSEVLSGASRGVRVRAYGEMVDVLWGDGRPEGALRLEELWCEAGREHEFALLCAYGMNHFGRGSDAGNFERVCQNYTHVLPTSKFFEAPDTAAQLREVTMLQQRARWLEDEVRRRRDVEAALRNALDRRAKVEEELRVALLREQEARTEAEANNSFRETFFGILGHELRNPLNSLSSSLIF